MRYGQLRQPLIDNGFYPIPIVPNDKRPAIQDWHNTAYLPPQGYVNHGVGIVCGKGTYPIAAVDIDVLDAEISARMQEFVTTTYGETFYRVGKSPKILFVYKAAEPNLRKVVSAKYPCGRVEILGAGQQFVAYGVHPETKQEYTWLDMIGGLEYATAESLPVIGTDAMKEIVKEFERLMGEKNINPIEKEKPKQTSDYDPNDPLDIKVPIGIDQNEVRTLLKDLDPDCSREQWCRVGMALHHEYNGSDEGCAIWDEWSRGGSKYKENEPEKQWQSFGKYSGQPVTAAYIVKLHNDAFPKERPEDTKGFFQKQNWSVARFINDPPEIPMLVENMIPRGIVSLFFSMGGAGKSTILLYLCARIAVSQEKEVSFFGQNITGGPAVIVTAEDPDLVINKRFIGVVSGLATELDMPVEAVREIVDKNLMIVSTFGHAVQLFRMTVDGSLKITDYYTSLVDCLKAIKDLNIVIIDTKTRFSPGEGAGNVTASQEITYYEAIAQQTNAHVMLLHHTNKVSRNGSTTGAQAYRDATALFDSVRAAWYLRGLTDEELMAQGVKNTEKQNYMLLENCKNNYIRKHDDILIYRDGYTYSSRNVKPKLSKEERRAHEEQEYINAIVPLFTRMDMSLGVAEMMELSDTVLERRKFIKILDNIEELGLIVKVPNSTRKLYTVTEEGLAHRASLETN